MLSGELESALVPTSHQEVSVKGLEIDVLLSFDLVKEWILQSHQKKVGGGYQSKTTSAKIVNRKNESDIKRNAVHVYGSG